jgi:hypothetical protein
MMRVSGWGADPADGLVSVNLASMSRFVAYRHLWAPQPVARLFRDRPGLSRLAGWESRSPCRTLFSSYCVCGAGP